MRKGNILVAVVSMMAVLLTMAVALSGVVLSTTIKIQKTYTRLSALSYAEAGINLTLFKVNQGSDTAFLNQAKTTQGKLMTDITGGQYRVWIQDCAPVSTYCNYIQAKGFIPTEAAPTATKTVRVKINGVDNVTNMNFAYSAQSGANQIQMSNNSKVKGSVYSNGIIQMDGGATITGNATSAGNSPSTSRIHFGNGSGATVNQVASAYTIDSKITAGSKVTGAYPPTQSPPIPASDLENTITGWETAAAAGWNSPGSFTVSSSQSLGPAKINGDLNINNTLQITGPIWVNGNVTISGGVSVYLASSFGNDSEVIIADYRADRTAKGKISIGNGAKISGTQKDNPKTTSFTMLFSTQTSNSSNWTSSFAIELGSPNVLGGVYYAPYGSYHQKNNGQIRAVACNGLVLDNGATIDYDQNWANSGISTGPAGKWTITEWLILY